MAIKASNQVDLLDMTDGYTVVLTNDNYTFLGTTTAVNGTQTTSTQVMALQGSETVPAKIGTITCPTGISAVSDGKTPMPTITITATSALTKTGSFTIPVTVNEGTVNEVTINKVFSYSIAFKGNQGIQGTSVKISSKSIQYVGSSSGTTTPTSGWQDTIPSVSAGNYLWTKTTVTYSDGTSTVSYSDKALMVHHLQYLKQLLNTFNQQAEQQHQLVDGLQLHQQQLLGNIFGQE